MKSNPLLRWLMIPVVLLAVFVGIRMAADDEAHHEPTAPQRLTPEEARALGVDGDTPRDTVATLVAQVRELRNELKTALADNTRQREANDRLRERDSTVEQRIQSAIENDRAQWQHERESAATEQQQTRGLLQELQRRVDALGSRTDRTEIPVGLGLEADEGVESIGVRPALRWIEPDDVRERSRRPSAELSSDASYPVGFEAPLDANEDASGQVARAVEPQRKNAAASKAVYTLPTNGTLVGSVAMTALIGRVPVDREVPDPFPFKIVIGPDNLTANGIDLPDIAGAVVSGTASGDWTLSCVRGQIRSVTFVFSDGTIRTIPDDAGRRTSAASNTTTQGGLGWISDPYGVPCVSGERRSNAQQYLGTQALLTAAGAGAAALIDSDSGRATYVGADGSIGTVGISANEAMGRVLASGVQEMSAYVNKLYGEAFAAVYVAPGAKVAVHLDEPLTIDYDPAGRRVDHHVGDQARAKTLD
jgi:integrating conjugative element protein (TIGR03752 family)